jgi:hypothetical protein
MQIGYEGDVPVGCAIAVMAKASIPGRTKTRLMPELTPEEAAGLNTSFLRDVADNIIATLEEERQHRSRLKWLIVSFSHEIRGIHHGVPEPWSQCHS